MQDTDSRLASRDAGDDLVGAVGTVVDEQGMPRKSREGTVDLRHKRNDALALVERRDNKRDIHTGLQQVCI
jgi:hypothetical protein